MKDANKGNPEITGQLDGKKLRIGIVQARWNADITDTLTEACLSELMELGVKAKHVTLVQVPGALEIPLALQSLADRSGYDALIALGCIIRGDTYHFELAVFWAATCTWEPWLRGQMTVIQNVPGECPI